MKSLKEICVPPTSYIRRQRYRKPQDTEHRCRAGIFNCLCLSSTAVSSASLPGAEGRPKLSLQEDMAPTLSPGPSSHSPAGSLCSSSGCLCSRPSSLPGNPAASPAALWPSSQSSPPTWRWSGAPLRTPSGCEERRLLCSHQQTVWLLNATLHKWPVNSSSGLAYFLHPKTNLSTQHNKYSYTIRMGKNKNKKKIPMWPVVCGRGMVTFTSTLGVWQGDYLG